MHSLHCPTVSARLSALHRPSRSSLRRPPAYPRALPSRRPAGHYAASGLVPSAPSPTRICRSRCFTFARRHAPKRNTPAPPQMKPNDTPRSAESSSPCERTRRVATRVDRWRVDGAPRGGGPLGGGETSSGPLGGGETSSGRCARRGGGCCVRPGLGAVQRHGVQQRCEDSRQAARWRSCWGLKGAVRRSMSWAVCKGGILRR